MAEVIRSCTLNTCCTFYYTLSIPLKTGEVKERVIPNWRARRKLTWTCAPSVPPAASTDPSRCSDSPSQQPPSPPRVDIHQVAKRVKCPSPSQPQRHLELGSCSLAGPSPSQPQRHLELGSCSLAGGPQEVASAVGVLGTEGLTGCAYSGLLLPWGLEASDIAKSHRFRGLSPLTSFLLPRSTT